MKECRQTKAGGVEDKDSELSSSAVRAECVYVS